jgi:hypothetical protein
MENRIALAYNLAEAAEFILNPPLKPKEKTVLSDTGFEIMIVGGVDS